MIGDFLEAILWTLSTIQWTDVLDIAILALIIYQTLKLLKGTRAFQSLLGLVGVLLLYAVSVRFDLFTVHWLLQKFLVYLVLAVVILFQQDIRRALARAGGRLFRPFATPSETSMLEEMVQACFTLASRRIGALIAIQRAASLEEYVESALRIDATPSQELLLSIFHPTSPMHDGAVIVVDGRIAAAKVFLPLSLSKDVSRFFGTRHRAALGLTEETDALVLIVSEERGMVSLAMGGTLAPMADINELRQRLQEVFATKKPPARAEPVRVGE
ncbi:MAG: diadenylate cyclase CdaA [Deltaproteobacteria bacterium]|nr:diadenylate cyclase CdaA [Deltaproteobacteria bacterium]